jgi:hypothetical protein
MFQPRLIAAMTAHVLLATAQQGQAAYTLDQLQQIDTLISQRNCEGLWLYVKSNPAILDGDDPLASELRVFVAASERGQLNCFASRENSPSADGAAARVAAPGIY